MTTKALNCYCHLPPKFPNLSQLQKPLLSCAPEHLQPPASIFLQPRHHQLTQTFAPKWKQKEKKRCFIGWGGKIGCIKTQRFLKYSILASTIEIHFASIWCNFNIWIVYFILRDTQCHKNRHPNLKIQPTNQPKPSQLWIFLFPLCCQQNHQADMGFRAASCGNKKSGCASPKHWGHTIWRKMLRLEVVVGQLLTL